LGLHRHGVAVSPFTTRGCPRPVRNIERRGVAASPPHPAPRIVTIAKRPSQRGRMRSVYIPIGILSRLVLRRRRRRSSYPSPALAVGRVAHRERSERCVGWGALCHWRKRSPHPRLLPTARAEGGKKYPLPSRLTLRVPTFRDEQELARSGARDTFIALNEIARPGVTTTADAQNLTAAAAIATIAAAAAVLGRPVRAQAPVGEHCCWRRTADGSGSCRG
jgi:hypothetical protein